MRFPPFLVGEYRKWGFMFEIVIAGLVGLVIGFLVGRFTMKGPQVIIEERVVEVAQPVQRTRGAKDHAARFKRAYEQATDPKRKDQLKQHLDYWTKVADLEAERP